MNSKMTNKIERNAHKKILLNDVRKDSTYRLAESLYLVE